MATPIRQSPREMTLIVQSLDHVSVMDYNEVRAEIIRQEADRMLLNFPPDPPIVDNPTWGAPPIQPTVREIRHTGGAHASGQMLRSSCT